MHAAFCLQVLATFGFGYCSQRQQGHERRLNTCDAWVHIRLQGPSTSILHLTGRQTTLIEN